jgi:branched-chain amino acid transport system permease protein
VFLAALGGALQIPRDAVHHAMDLRIIVEVFVVVVIGGLGSIIGAFVAAVLVSELNAFGILIFPKISIILVFLVMAAVLIVRPWGLFGKPEAPARKTPGLTVNPWRPLTSNERLAALAALVIAATLPLFAGNYALTVGSEIAIFVIFAVSLHFLMSVGGLASFGHAAYFGLGAYGAGLALKFLAPSTPLALLCGTLLGGIAGTLLGALIARRRGVYFAMVTIAFGQVFYYIAFQWSSVTGGDDGLRGFSRQPLDLGVARIDILSNANAFYYFVLFCLALAIGVMGFILRSPFGRTMIAIRENERRARFLGIPVDRHIWIAFTLSCFFMGFAGALYALLNNFADPRGLHYSQSGDFVMMAVMGGMRSLWGPLLGAAVFVVLQDYLSSVTVNWMSFVGMLFVAIVLFFPRGLLGFIQRRSDS